MANNQPNQVDEVIHDLKSNVGAKQYVILNNDGIVIKYEGMDYSRAVQHAYLVLDLCAKSKSYFRGMFEAPENEVESIRLKTNEFEMIISQIQNFTLVMIQDTRPQPEEDEEVVAEGDEKKD